MQLLQPLARGASLETTRKFQDALGELMARSQSRTVLTEVRNLGNFDGIWAFPKKHARQGVILYLHGGGYIAGSLEYATGFASILSSRCNIRVFAPAYRLAPEHPFPTAVEDVEIAYRYLLECGYRPQEIVLCGESAGGGLIFSLCLRLREQNMARPCGLIAISPWTDLTVSSPSYEANREKDHSISRELLQFYASTYAGKALENPLVSPLFGDLQDFPPSLIFSGGDEIMLDDARLLHEKLQVAGRDSQWIVTPGMWHAYVLYCLKENKQDFVYINDFLHRLLPEERSLRWMRLDNAAKIFPANKRRNWSNLFRLAATLEETVDPVILQSALDVTVRRFPSIAVRLRRGAFWYYLEEIPVAPQVQKEKAYPLAHMPVQEICRCAFRVLYYENRIAAEFFHALTDGNGGLIFLKSLVAEYLKQRYQVSIPYENGVLNPLEEPREEELEDSFQRYSGDVSKRRAEEDSFRLRGDREADGFLHLTTFMIPADAVFRLAREQKVTVTVVLCSAIMMALQSLQDERKPRHRQKPVKVLIPVDLRRLFPSESLRNFALYVTPGIDPRMGEWSFEEVCKTVHHQMGASITPKEMMSRITPNIRSERSPLLKIMPLFIKNIAMKAVYNAVGEKKACLSFSNLGRVELPTEMMQYVNRLDFQAGPQSILPCTCGILAYKGMIYINFIRNTREPLLERRFYEELRRLGIPVKVESNAPHK